MMSDYIPKHVGLIPDGARRWARKNNCTYTFAYSKVMNNVVDFATTMFNHQVKVVSVYLLSKDNLNRSPEDLESVYETECYLVQHMLPALAQTYSARVVHAGNPALLPAHFASAIECLCQQTAHLNERVIYLLIAYDPHDEITFAYEQGKQHVPIWSHMWVPEKVDLVIRTSGEYRTSNFLPLQSGYAEYVFVDKDSVEITPVDMETCLNQYYERKRRFGN